MDHHGFSFSCWTSIGSDSYPAWIWRELNHMFSLGPTDGPRMRPWELAQSLHRGTTETMTPLVDPWRPASLLRSAGRQTHWRWFWSRAAGVIWGILISSFCLALFLDVRLFRWGHDKIFRPCDHLELQWITCFSFFLMFFLVQEVVHHHVCPNFLISDHSEPEVTAILMGVQPVSLPPMVQHSSACYVPP